jgi:hypothetical protein
VARIRYLRALDIGSSVNLHIPLDVLIDGSLLPTSHIYILEFPFFFLVLLPLKEGLLPQKNMAHQKEKIKKSFPSFQVAENLMANMH